MNKQACRVQVTTRHLAWCGPKRDREVKTVIETFAAFPCIRLRSSNVIPGLRAPVEAVITIDPQNATTNSLEFAWRQRGGVPLPRILAKMSVRRILGFLRMFEFIAEYDVPPDIALRTYDDVVGKWVILALMERFAKTVMAIAARQPTEWSLKK